MGSIEYILTAIAGLTNDNLDALQGKGFFNGGFLLKGHLGNVAEFVTSVLKLDSASIDHLGSSELTDGQKSSLDGLFGLSSDAEEPAQ